VPPTVFVAVAERAGLVSALDDFVLERACRDVAAHLARHGSAPSVHVNISATRLGSPDLELVVTEALRRHGLSARHLVLEITETGRIPDPVAAARSAERLRAAGVRLALDDFGTGYNTLAQLHTLPVDVVKLDRTLTAIGPEALRAEALCRSLVTIAADLGVTVIAEGVETAEQEAALARLGCGFGQGHLYGLPVSWTPARIAGVHELIPESDRTRSRESRIPAG
jgi:EAL domain-containing protein (putative c-di-GMP-specific phosphodiesterase class I)